VCVCIDLPNIDGKGGVRICMNKKKIHPLSNTFLFSLKHSIYLTMSSNSADEADFDLKEQDRFLPIAK
jgi:hypothetical protein